MRQNARTMSLLSRLRPVIRRPTRRTVRWAFRGLVLLVVALLGYEVFRVIAWTNRHTVIPGRVYRSAQPSGDELWAEVRDKNIRTVINLRGVSPGNDWYTDEARAAHDLNVSQEDVTLSANRLPPPAELRRLVEVLDHTEYPVLIHCKRGADRTGLVSTIARLLYTDDTLSQAKRQLWPRYGHFEFGRTAALDRFFELYEDWLSGDAHTPARFRDWVLNHYSPGPARSELAWLDSVPNPVPRDKPFSLRVRATNRSSQAWEFKPGNYAGIHLGYVVAGESLVPVHRGQAGLLRATVKPGESIDLTVVVPPLKAPGRYALVAELHDATQAGVPIRANSFVQFGDESLMAEVIVK
jgi:protein tyrosine phosphatase (PTP) superfamily phosphohydrolase (DUF442 family)